MSDMVVCRNQYLYCTEQSKVIDTSCIISILLPSRDTDLEFTFLGANTRSVYLLRYIILPHNKETIH